SEDSQDDEDDEEFAPENVTFAPKDVTPVDFSPKLGVQGLGYRGLDPGLALLGRGAPEHIDLFRPQSEARSRLFGDARRGSRRGGGVAGQAFGVGALEDDDDEEVYHRDSMSRYDTTLGGEEPGDGLYGWTAPQQYAKKRDRSKDASYLGKILEGFTLAQNPPQDQTIFPPPSLPRDYRPVRRFRPVAVHVSGLSGVSPALAEALRASRGHMVKEEPQQGGGRHQLDSGQRRTLLEEDALQGPSSVLELLRPEDRQRLLNLRNSPNVPSTKTATPASHDASRPAAGSSAGGGAASSGHEQQQEALTAWRGVQTSSQTFRPFEMNPSKQARYELYLNGLKQGDKDGLEQSLDPGMTEWERSRERDEFVRASILYRPTSSSLSSRFTRAKTQEEEEDSVEVSRDQEGDVEDKEAAVNMKMFGKLTRETFEWHPDKLLCKRFNIPNPYPESSLVGLPKVKRDKFSVFNFLSVTESRETTTTTAPPKPPEAGKRSRWDVSDRKEEEKKKSDPLSELLIAARIQTETKLSQTSSNTPASPSSPSSPASSSITNTERKSADQQNNSDKKRGGDEEEEEEEEEESRPPMDLFKAIFAGSSDDKSSSSSSEGESNDEVEVKDEVHPQPLNLFSITSSTTPSVTSSSQQKAPVSSLNSAQQQQQQEEFGPKLPPPSAALTRGGATSLCPPREEEKPSSRSKEKKHKNKKQHKHKKEKKKKKHKKHKHRGKQQKKSKKETDNSSEDSDGDGDAAQVSTQELLQRLKDVQSRETW
ncbi:G patch domain-containing protein 1, partial [Sebastes fasciatus]|uniref:G patch domain-containing protein 1 n=1 Tax=Sebastes fasciatus TaxID=394691 RepID=UPI003D9DF73D